MTTRGFSGSWDDIFGPVPELGEAEELPGEENILSDSAPMTTQLPLPSLGSGTPGPPMADFQPGPAVCHFYY